MLFQGVEQPLQDEESAFGGVGLFRGCDEEGSVFGPVGGELDQGLCAEDEGGGGQGGEVAVEGGY